jgi:hypothetical protein
MRDPSSYLRQELHRQIVAAKLSTQIIANDGWMDDNLIDEYLNNTDVMKALYAFGLVSWSLRVFHVSTQFPLSGRRESIACRRQPAPIVVVRGLFHV